MQSYYDELEVSPSASHETIHAAFSSLTQRLSNGGGPVDAVRMNRLVTAYTVLTNEQQRAEYNATLNSGGIAPDAVNAVSVGVNDAQPLPPPILPQSPSVGLSLEAFLAKPVVPILIGSNLEGFRASWTIAFAKTRSLPGVSNAISWSWPAFLCGPFYLCYRKMYAYAAAWTAGAFLIALLVAITHVEAFSGAYTALGVTLAMKAKGFYLQHVHSQAQEIETRYPVHASQVAVATAKGGTSWAMCIFGGLACLIVASVPDFFGAMSDSGQSQAQPPGAHRTDYHIASLPSPPAHRMAS